MSYRVARQTNKHTTDTTELNTTLATLRWEDSVIVIVGVSLAYLLFSRSPQQEQGEEQQQQCVTSNNAANWN